MPVDPTQDDRYNQVNETQFPQLSAPVQQLVRELLEETYINNIVVYDGEQDWLEIKSRAGISGGEVAKKMIEAGLRLSIIGSRGGTVTIDGKENDDN